MQEAQSNSIEALEGKVEEMRECAKSVAESLNALMAEAREEQAEEETYRRSFPQAPIPIDILKYIQMIQQYTTVLSQAASGESKVEEAMKSVEAFKPFLQGTKESIDAQLPTGSVTAETASLLDDLRAVNDEVSKLIRDKTVDQQGLFVRGFTPIAERLSELKVSFESQDSYLAKLESRLNAFTQAVQADPVVMERQHVFEGISNALRAQSDALKFVEEGTTFYKKLEEIVAGIRANFNTELEKARVARGPSMQQGGQPQYSPYNQFTPYGQYSQYSQQQSNPQQSTPQQYGQYGQYGQSQYGQYSQQQPGYMNQGYSGYNQAGSITCQMCGSLNHPGSRTCITCGKML